MFLYTINNIPATREDFLEVVDEQELSEHEKDIADWFTSGSLSVPYEHYWIEVC